MAYESLIMGVLFSIGIFAIKSGVGIAYAIGTQEKKRAKVGAFMLFAIAYGLVFVAAAMVLTIIDPVRHLDVIQSFIRSGMLVHIIMAGLLMGWGLLLLKRSGAYREKSKGWLLLAVPCPVCITVIFFSAGFLLTLFPNTPKSIVSALYSAFVLINLATVVVISLLRKGRTLPAESLLGGAMILIALYFFISVTVMPQFADVDKIYRLALYHGKTPLRKVVHLVPFTIMVAAAFIGGFGFMSKKIRRIT
jgi:predicted transporter